MLEYAEGRKRHRTVVGTSCSLVNDQSDLFQNSWMLFSLRKKNKTFSCSPCTLLVFVVQVAKLLHGSGFPVPQQWFCCLFWFKSVGNYCHKTHPGLAKSSCFDTLFFKLAKSRSTEWNCVFANQFEGGPKNDFGELTMWRNLPYQRLEFCLLFGRIKSPGSIPFACFPPAFGPLGFDIWFPRRLQRWAPTNTWRSSLRWTQSRWAVSSRPPGTETGRNPCEKVRQISSPIRK